MLLYSLDWLLARSGSEGDNPESCDRSEFKDLRQGTTIAHSLSQKSSNQNTTYSRINQAHGLFGATENATPSDLKQILKYHRANCVDCNSSNPQEANHLRYSGR